MHRPPTTAAVFKKKRAARAAFPISKGEKSVTASEILSNINLIFLKRKKTQQTIVCIKLIFLIFLDFEVLILG